MDFGKLHNFDRVGFSPSCCDTGSRFGGRRIGWGVFILLVCLCGKGELDRTFYRIPDDATIQHWREVTPESFQGISHDGALLSHRDFVRQFSRAVLGL